MTLEASILELPNDGDKRSKATSTESLHEAAGFGGVATREISKDDVQGSSQTPEADDFLGVERLVSVSVNEELLSVHPDSSASDKKSFKEDTKTPNDVFIESLQVLFRELLGTTPNSTSDYAEQTKTLRKRLFGLTKGLSPCPGSNNRFDYEQKYPRDKPGEELADNARVWLTYLDEADAYDREKVEGWKETVDILLVFAGLFSGVITAFVTQASQSLQQNYTQVTASLMFEMVQLQRAQFSGIPISDISNSTLTPASPFKPSKNALVVNGLWYTSLAISLATALIAVLAKQWLHYYMSAISGTAIEKVRVRHFRFRGLELWKVGLIVDLLPVLLHLALGIFLIGVIVFLFPLDNRVASVIVVIVGITYTFYLISIILPIRYPECPYTTSLTIYIGDIFYFGSALTRSVSQKALFFGRNPYIKALYQRILYWSNLFREKFPQMRTPFHSSTNVRRNDFAQKAFTNPDFGALKRQISNIEFPKWREDNRDKAIRAGHLDLKALRWLHTISSNPSVRRIVARGVSVHPNSTQELGKVVTSLGEGLRIDPMDLEDLRYGLCMDIQHASLFTGNWELLWNIPKEHLGEEYQNYSFVAENVHRRNYDQILKDALKDVGIKFPSVMWRHFLANTPGNVTLTGHILTSNVNPFDWNSSNSDQHSAYETGEVPFKVMKPGKLFFDYLFRNFCDGKSPDYSSEIESFEARYLLLVSLYRNLTSDSITFDKYRQEKKALERLFWNFRSWLWVSESRDIPVEVFLSFHKDILCVDAFWNQPMTNFSRRDAIWSLHRIQEIFGFFKVSRLPFIQCQDQDMSCIYEWCSRDLSETQRRDTSYMISLLFMPQNRTHLFEELSRDPNPTYHFSKCIQNLRCPMTSENERVQRNFVYPSLRDLFKRPPKSLFTVLYDFSVLVEVWKFLVYNDKLNEKEFLRIVKSKLDQKNLRRLYIDMIHETRPEPEQSTEFRAFVLRFRNALEPSARDFGRTIGVDDSTHFTYSAFEPTSVLEGSAQEYHDVEAGVQELNNVRPLSMIRWMKRTFKYYVTKTVSVDLNRAQYSDIRLETRMHHSGWSSNEPAGQNY